MATPSAKRNAVRFTYQDYLLLDEGTRCELIEGDFRVTPAPNPFHQDISKRLELELIQQLEKHGLGKLYHAPIDVVLSEEDVFQPDVLFIRRDRLGIIQKQCIRGAPDLVIEILSPSHEDRDRVIKRKLYDKFGVREYWIVDPEARSIEIFVAGDDGFISNRTYTAPATLSSPSLPELKIALAPVFEP